jgi:hypothetical protein
VQLGPTLPSIPHLILSDDRDFLRLAPEDLVCSWGPGGRWTTWP